MACAQEIAKMMVKWVLCTVLFGTVLPIPNTPQFGTRSGCELFRHNTLGEQVTEAFKVHCVAQWVDKPPEEPEQ